MMLGKVDDLRRSRRLLGHDLAMPVAIMVDKALGSVAVGAFDRDIVDIRPAALDCHDFVGPILTLEPMSSVYIPAQRLLFPAQSKADLVLKNGSPLPCRMDVP